LNIEIYTIIDSRQNQYWQKMVVCQTVRLPFSGLKSGSFLPDFSFYYTSINYKYQTTSWQAVLIFQRVKITLKTNSLPVQLMFLVGFIWEQWKAWQFFDQ
jgi:hypothetical protein